MNQAIAATRFPNLLSEFVYTRTYSRWMNEESRREKWPETVTRYVNYVCAKLESAPDVSEALLSETRSELWNAIVNMDTLPSMRAMWSAGKSLEADNCFGYNCAFLPIDSVVSFTEALYILMCGTGVGFSVESQFVNNLPKVYEPSEGYVSTCFTVPDSTIGWKEAFEFGLMTWWQGGDVVFDYSLVREKGSILKTKGGRASGPEPLKKLLDFARKMIMGAQGRQLRPIECHDLMCIVGEVVVVGGVRRAALISVSDPWDVDMRHAKDWSDGKTFPSLRYMSNNSSYWEERPEPELFWQEWVALQRSGSGERGFLIDNFHLRSDRPKGSCRTNPCGEIGLRFKLSTNPWTGEGGGGQFCNLTATVVRPWDTLETMLEKVRLAAILGTIQASWTHFPHIRPGWAETCNEDRLLGVDITGQCDNPTLCNDPESMRQLNRMAIDTNIEWARRLGINEAAAVTCGKPSGNSSQLVNCASGFHHRFSSFYFRHVRISAADPLFLLARDSGIPYYKENGQEDRADEDVEVWVVRFPVRAPEGSVLRNSETAIEQLERYLHIMRTWCGEKGHNQSATIYVKEHEWDEVGAWVYENFDEITGVSFLPFDGGKYNLAPYVEITEAEYEIAQAEMPIIDFDILTLYEKEDRGEGSTELACVGGSCEIDFDKMAMEATAQ